MKKKHILWIVLSLAGGAACLFACAVGYILYQVGTTASNASKSAALIGNAAPDFALVSLDEKTVHLSQMLDRPVYLCFGTTWCPDCKKEAPLLQKFHEQHPEVRVLWIDSQEDPATVKQYMKQEGLTLPVVVDPDGRVAKDYMVWAVPTIYIIDTDGIIKARFVENLTQEDLDKTLSDLGIEP